MINKHVRLPIPPSLQIVSFYTELTNCSHIVGYPHRNNQGYLQRGQGDLNSRRQNFLFCALTAELYPRDCTQMPQMCSLKICIHTFNIFKLRLSTNALPTELLRLILIILITLRRRRDSNPRHFVFKLDAGSLRKAQS